MVREFLEKSPESPRIVDFLKCEPFNRKNWKFREQSRKTNFGTKFFNIWVYHLRLFSLFLEIFENAMFHSLLDVVENSCSPKVLIK